MQTFEDRHAQVDPDPLVELKRRLQVWAFASTSRGEPLKPEAVIVPCSTVAGAIELLEQFAKLIDVMQRAKVKGNA